MFAPTLAALRSTMQGLGPRLLLSCILSVALVFAVVGIDWGLPYNWHADEKVNLAAPMVERHTGDPGFFVNPTLHLYLVWTAVRVSYAVYPTAFVPSDVRWHVLSTRRNAPNRGITFLAYRLARSISIAFGLATVWLLWRRGRAAFDTATGLLAAGCLAVTMGLANLSHFATPETTLFFLVLSALGSVEAIAHAPTRGRYAIAGALIGLACSTKYTVWLLVIPFLLAHVKGGGRVSLTRNVGWGLLAGLVAVLAFVLGTPFSVLSARRFLEDLWFNWRTGAPSGSLAEEPRSWIAYLITLGDALGWPLFLAMAGGATFLVMRARRLDERAFSALLIHGSWIAAFWAFYGISPHYALRFIMPIVPSLILLGAGGILQIARTSRSAQLTISTAMGVVVLYSVLYTAEADRKFVLDPRYAAGAWLKAHVSPDVTVGFFANQSYLPYFDRPAYKIVYLDFMSQLGITGDAFQERVKGVLDAGPDIIVDANFYFDRFVGAPDVYPERAAFYRRLLAGAGAGTYRPIATFSIHGPAWLDPRPELVAPDVYVFGRMR